jgi:hypothetical protein
MQAQALLRPINDFLFDNPPQKVILVFVLYWNVENESYLALTSWDFDSPYVFLSIFEHFLPHLQGAFLILEVVSSAWVTEFV